MTKQRSSQTVQKIKVDLQEGWYNLRRVPVGERDPLRKKRIKKLWKKIDRMKDELTGDRMLLFFELEKELEDERMDGEN